MKKNKSIQHVILSFILGVLPLKGFSEEISSENFASTPSLQNIKNYTKSIERNVKITGYTAMTASAVSFITKALLFWAPAKEQKKYVKKTTPKGDGIPPQGLFLPHYFEEDIYLPSPLMLYNDQKTLLIKQEYNDDKVTDSIEEEFWVSKKKWEIMPWTYGLIHINAVSNAISSLALLGQALSTTYYTLKVQKELGKEDTVLKNPDLLKEVKGKATDLLKVQWLATGGILTLSSLCAFFTSSLSPFKTLREDLVQTHPFKTALISLLLEGTQFYLTKKMTDRVSSLAQDLGKSLEYERLIHGDYVLSR